MRRFLAVFLCFALVGCGPGLADIVRLRGLADKAKASCVSAPAAKKAERCELMLACASSAEDAAKAIQSLQEARKAGTATAAAPALSAGLYAGSVATCGVAGVK
jgi:O-acetyl-ADP-ribose deacetylase (regulator of RNase III)